MIDRVTSLDDYRSSARYFNGPHGRIAWWMRGHGRPLLLIHGFPTCSYDWSRIWPGLVESGFNPIALDMLGFGLSDKPAQHRYDLMQQADLHVQLMQALEIVACRLWSAQRIRNFDDPQVPETGAQPLPVVQLFSLQQIRLAARESGARRQHGFEFRTVFTD